MAQNLAYELRQAYDEALSRYDVLVMPTLPLQATVIPAPTRRGRRSSSGPGDDRQHVRRST